MTRIPQKGYSYASKENALSQRQAEGSPSDSDSGDGETDIPQHSGPPGKQLRMPPPSATSNGSSSSDESDDYASVSSSSDSEDESSEPLITPQYPILGARARKRVRPPTSYSKRMAVYIRVCLLQFRETNPIELKNEDHFIFQKELKEEKVERVVIPDTPPSEKSHPVNESSHDDITTKKEKKKEKKKIKKKINQELTSKNIPSTEKKNEKKIDLQELPKEVKKIESKTIKPSSSTPPTTGENGSKSTDLKSNEDKPVSMSPADKSPVKRPACTIEETIPPTPKKRKLTNSFQIPTNSNASDMDRVRQEATQLQKEGIALKHDGDKKGRENIAAQGVAYLRASAKFLQQALLMSDLKAMYKALNDTATASKWGKDSISTLSQTFALIESTVGFFSKSGEKRRMALSYKFGAIVMLTSYRLQHNMLYGYYSQLYTPGRSPDGNSSSLSTNQDPIRSLILKEMGAMMRGFEFWRRFEACGQPDVLAHIQDPSTVDLTTLWKDLEDELST